MSQAEEIVEQMCTVNSQVWVSGTGRKIARGWQGVSSTSEDLGALRSTVQAVSLGGRDLEKRNALLMALRKSRGH